jgi:hypothetical protein
MQRENSAIAAFKVWVFPSLVSIVSLLIWNDVNEIKADVKALMAQSNIDKTRIDNLERQVYGSKTASLPETPEKTDNSYNPTYAVLPNNEVKYKRKKLAYDY